MHVDFSIPVPNGLLEYVQEEINELDEYYRNDDLMYMVIEDAAYAHIKHCYAEKIITAGSGLI